LVGWQEKDKVKMPISSFFGGVQRFAGQALGQAQRAYSQLDQASGGWLPGGGTASPLTRAKQEGERKMANQIRRQSEQYVGQPGRFAGQGQLLNAIRATTQAGTNPVSVALGNSKAVEKVSQYYAQYPEMQNEFDLNTNMFLRYLSDTGADGLKIAPEVGKQIYSDIKQREQQLINPQYRESIISNPINPSYMKQGLLAGRTPVYYGGSSEAIVPQESLLPTDKGERWQLDKSLGSYWAEPIDDGYAIKNERYNFGYAPVNKEGIENAQRVSVPGGIADLGRKLVQKGFGNPFTYNLNVSPSGVVKAYP
jgi:hypothetical protein